MTQLDQAVQSAVETYRKTFFLALVLTALMCVVQGQFVAALVVLMIFGATYHLGLLAVGYLLSRFLPKEVLMNDLQSRRIAEINERLQNGTLEAGSEELETMMKLAGLEPLSVVQARGPVFGKQFDAELYEWIEAKKGREGEVLRYTYVGEAHFDEDGCAQATDDSGEFIVLDGFMYRAEPKNVDVRQL